MPSIIRVRRNRFGIGNGKAPRVGESIVTNLAQDQGGIDFEVSRMASYVREFRLDPTMVKVARRIVELCQAKDKTCEMKVLFAWVCQHFRYINDPPDEEFVQTPLAQLREIGTPPEILRALLGDKLIEQIFGFGVAESLMTPDFEGKKTIVCASCFEPGHITGPHMKSSGDCDEGATFLATLLQAAGIESKFRFGAFVCGDAPAYQHVWVQGRSANGEWLDMDVTEPQRPFGWYHEGFRCFGEVVI